MSQELKNYWMTSSGSNQNLIELLRNINVFQQKQEIVDERINETSLYVAEQGNIAIGTFLVTGNEFNRHTYMDFWKVQRQRQEYMKKIIEEHKKRMKAIETKFNRKEI